MRIFVECVWKSFSFPRLKRKPIITSTQNILNYDNVIKIQKHNILSIVLPSIQNRFLLSSEENKKA
jgi:hypothetical protein